MQKVRRLASFSEGFKVHGLQGVMDTATAKQRQALELACFLETQSIEDARAERT